MLRYRDGARVFGGTFMPTPTLFRTVELTLRTLLDAGFALSVAARAFPTLLHYTVGFVIEEQARKGLSYAAQNPYSAHTIAGLIDTQQFPLTAETIGQFFDSDGDAAFEDGLKLILSGMRQLL